ncbi:gluconokinase [Sphingorhabdus sp. Alg231-15]|uniref:gluconokinase n=1 Tax=Sphingorhabdus sp. Alg231-15 TaxID=1922222 RepID=UPI00307C5B80
MHVLLVIMGVSGCGKSTVSLSLSRHTGWPFLEGDVFHPPENLQKMAAVESLNQEDRIPWIDAMAKAVNDTGDGPVILACSALNDAVRLRLSCAVERPCHWIYLNVPDEILQQRMEDRTGHFMPPTLLQSQLQALELPLSRLTVDGMQTPEAICDVILSALDKRIE